MVNNVFKTFHKSIHRFHISMGKQSFTDRRLRNVKIGGLLFLGFAIQQVSEYTLSRFRTPTAYDAIGKQAIDFELLIGSVPMVSIY